MKNEKGQVVILFALLLPVFAAFLSMLVNLFYVFDASVRLQTALDRGVFAGAAKLSYLLNEIGVSNWVIRKGFVELKNDFDGESQGGDECLKRLKELKIMQDDELSRINSILDTAYAEAFSIANEVLEANLPENGTLTIVEVEPLIFSADDRPLNALDSGDQFEAQRENINCDKIEGSVVDPTSNTLVAKKELLKFLISDSSKVFVAMKAKGRVLPLLFSSIFPPVEISVTSGAAPVGGSLRDFAFTEASNDDEAKEKVFGSADGPYYRPVMLPQEIFSADGDENVAR